MRTLIEFLGGDWDGKTLDSDSQDEHETNVVSTILDMTHNGTIGKAYYGIGMGVAQAVRDGTIKIGEVISRDGKVHKYKVVERLEEGEEVLIRLEHGVQSPDEPIE